MATDSPQPFRRAEGGRIDRNRPLRFTFNGQSLEGYAGDSLASALLAHGIRVVARSFKYHRPRGLMAAGFEEPNALVQLGEGASTEPNVKATEVLLHDGLVARAAKTGPKTNREGLGLTNRLGRFLPAGFYYKTFLWPHWHLYEPMIRRMAGLGTAPTEADPDAYDQHHAHCDVLVIGGGPAGLAAALVAGDTGARVILVDDKPEWGGSLLFRTAQIEGGPGAQWVEATQAELSSRPETVLLPNTVALGYYDHNYVTLIETPEPAAGRPRQRFWKVRAGRIILATGALERPLIFPNNDRPGVMLAGAVQHYANRFAALAGRRAVVATNNDTAYEAALEARAAGIEIMAIVDSRPHPDGSLVQEARKASIAVLPGSAPTDSVGINSVEAVELHRIDEEGQAKPGGPHRIECDLIMAAGGWSPTAHLFSQSGGKLRFDREREGFVPETSVQDEISIGAATGQMDLTSSLKTASLAGQAAAEQAGFPRPSRKVEGTCDHALEAPRSLWTVDVSALPGRRGKAWVDFQNDVTADDIALAVRENYRSVEHVKRYTTLGMAVDQGKTANVNAIGLLHRETGKPIPEIGTTTFRPPFNPVTVGAVVGRNRESHLHPRRLLPAHSAHEGLAATFEDQAGWRRPACYPRSGETEAQTVAREVLAVRRGVGLFDGSPLGKIEVTGPDALRFLNRLYVNNMKTLAVGQCRYGLMLNDLGVIMDDGVLARRSDHDFQMITSAGRAETVAGWIEEWRQCAWRDLRVLTEPVTTQWATLTVSGPSARTLLRALDSDIDFSAQAFPHRSIREGWLEGVRTRIIRMSLTGELSYEVSVPWGYGAALWERLMVVGETYGITAYGTQALTVLRTEKGHLQVGSDTDGSTLPQDVGFARVMDKKGDDFIGRRSALLPAGQEPARRQFVGLEALDGATPLPVGGHVIGLRQKPPAASQGYVTSSHMSPTLGKPIALGMVSDGFDRRGEEIVVFDNGSRRRARIVSPVFYDPIGERVHG